MTKCKAMKKFLLTPPRYLIFITCLFVFSSVSKSYGQDNENLSCTSRPSEAFWESDPFVNNNALIVDILNSNGFSIPEDYLYNLSDTGEYIGDGVLRIPNLELNRNHSTENRNLTSTTLRNIPMKIWIYRNDDGTGNISEQAALDIIDEINLLFVNTNIQFYPLCDISIINNTTTANSGDFSNYTLNNRVENVLNMHLIINHIDNPYWAGKGNYPDKDGDSNYLEGNSYSFALRTQGFYSAYGLDNIGAHEIGHTFGIMHTHQARCNGENSNADCGDCYQESVSRTKTQGAFCLSQVGDLKCETNGDRICDTPADPDISDNVGPIPNCNYTGGGQDNWGDSWIPDTNNLMSYSNIRCLTEFSISQIGTMHFYANELYPNNQILTLNGPSLLCSNITSTYTVSGANSGVTHYNWSVTGDLSLGFATGSSVNVTATGISGGTLILETDCGHPIAKRFIEGTGTIEIAGPAQDLCPGTRYNFNVINYSGATYNWNVSGGIIISGQGTSTIEVEIVTTGNQITDIDCLIGNYCQNNIYTQDLFNQIHPNDCVDNGGIYEQQPISNISMEVQNISLYQTQLQETSP